MKQVKYVHLLICLLFSYKRFSVNQHIPNFQIKISEQLNENLLIWSNLTKRHFILQKKVQADICVTQATVKEALDILRGAVMIVYPMGLPPHDKIKAEFENEEDLAGTQVSVLNVLTH